MKLLLKAILLRLSPHLKVKLYVVVFLMVSLVIDGRTVDTVRALDICTGVLPLELMVLLSLLVVKPAG